MGERERGGDGASLSREEERKLRGLRREMEEGGEGEYRRAAVCYLIIISIIINIISRLTIHCHSLSLRCGAVTVRP